MTITYKTTATITLEYDEIQRLLGCLKVAQRWIEEEDIITSQESAHLFTKLLNSLEQVKPDRGVSC